MLNLIMGLFDGDVVPVSFLVRDVSTECEYYVTMIVNSVATVTVVLNEHNNVRKSNKYMCS